LDKYLSKKVCGTSSIWAANKEFRTKEQGKKHRDQ